MFQIILTALREARQIRQFIALAEQAEFWTPVDGMAMVKFMTTTTGQKLRARLNNMVFKSAIRSCSVPANGDYERGIARGVLLTIKALDEHMESARQPNAKDFVESTDEVKDSEVGL
jgi:hypothetical protein